MYENSQKLKDRQEKQREIWTVRRFWSLWICPWFYKTLNYLSQINVYWIFSNLISLIWRLLAMTHTNPAELEQQLLPADLNTHSHPKKQTTRWLKVLLKTNNFPKLCFYSLVSVKTLQFISFCGASGPRVCDSRLVLSHMPWQEDELNAVPPSNRRQPRDFRPKPEMQLQHGCLTSAWFMASVLYEKTGKSCGGAFRCHLFSFAAVNGYGIVRANVSDNQNHYSARPAAAWENRYLPRMQKATFK